MFLHILFSSEFSKCYQIFLCDVLCVTPFLSVSTGKSTSPNLHWSAWMETMRWSLETATKGTPSSWNMKLKPSLLCHLTDGRYCSVAVCWATVYSKSCMYFCIRTALNQTYVWMSPCPQLNLLMRRQCTVHINKASAGHMLIHIIGPTVCVVNQRKANHRLILTSLHLYANI